MQLPLEITFRDVPRHESLKGLVRGQAAKLERLCDRIISCRVAIERPQRHRRVGNSFRVRISVTVPPGKEIVAVRDPADSHMHDDLPTVVIGAFRAARRRVRAFVERQRGVPRKKRGHGSEG